MQTILISILTTVAVTSLLIWFILKNVFGQKLIAAQGVITGHAVALKDLTAERESLRTENIESLSRADKAESRNEFLNDQYQLHFEVAG